MDFLDPKKERLNRIILFFSYGLIALAIGIASLILLYQTNGYCVDGKGSVDRCGLVFLSSQPNGATIAIDGKTKKPQTNTKFDLQSGTYQLRLSQDGYRDWQHEVTVLGGDVQRFDYPFLFPKTLTTNSAATFTSSVTMATQSPDRRWLVVAEGTQPTNLRLYDLKNAVKPVATSIAIPTGLVTAGDGAQTWKAVEWSNDNRHLIALHGYTTAGATSQEYVLIDRQAPENSKLLTRDLSLTPPEQLSLFDKKYNQYYVYNTEAKTLRTIALVDTAPTSRQLDHVVAFKTYADDTILYATDTPPSGKVTPGYVSIILQQGNQTRVLRQLPATATVYLLEIAQYSGDWYVAVGSNTEKGVHIYRNPLDQQLSSANAVPVPIRFLKIAQPNYVAFSANTQYIVAENGQQFAVYDAEYDKTTKYTSSAPLDAPQAHASWMDGNRFVYISGGSVYVFDYDGLNSQTLLASSADWPVFFTPDYKALYNIQPQPTAGTSRLAQTQLTLQ